MRRWDRLAVAVAAFLLLAPVADAEPATLSLSSAEPVLLHGHVAIVARGGAAHVYDPAARGAYDIQNVTGWIRVYTVQSANSRTSPRVVQSVPGTLDTQEFYLDRANVTIALAGERFELRALSADTGAITAEGDIASVDLPRRLLERVETEAGTGLASFGPPEKVTVRWEAGWTFAGAYAAYDAVPLPGFPAPTGGATLGIRGGVRAHLVGGIVAFTDATGERREFRTGNWTTQSDGSPIETRRDVFIEGVAEGAHIDAGPFWGVGSPDASWRLDGDVLWTDASGTAVAGSTRRSFAHETVRGRGVLLVQPDPPGLVRASGSDVAYGVAGDWEALRVGGDALVAPPELPLAAIAGASLLLLLLAAGGVTLYTRLAPGDLLDHPQRRRIYREVEAHNGVHLRELHRRAGGGWGTFRVHLHLLVRAGYVRVERRAQYALVFPVHAAHAGALVVIPHPLTRAVYDALPADGTPVPLRSVRERVGMTRQLLNYHAQRLERDGLVRVTTKPNRERLVARA